MQLNSFQYDTLCKATPFLAEGHILQKNLHVPCSNVIVDSEEGLGSQLKNGGKFKNLAISQMAYRL